MDTRHPRKPPGSCVRHLCLLDGSFHTGEYPVCAGNTDMNTVFRGYWFPVKWRPDDTISTETRRIGSRRHIDTLRVGETFEATWRGTRFLLKVEKIVSYGKDTEPEISVGCPKQIT